jgi:hypothetical protein
MGFLSHVQQEAKTSLSCRVLDAPSIKLDKTEAHGPIKLIQEIFCAEPHLQAHL